MKAEKIIFIIKSESGLPLSDSEKKKITKKVSKIAADNRTAIFQTYDDKTGLTLLVKNGFNKGRSELYNIFCSGVTDCVSHTISYIEKYATTEKVLVVFIDNRDFITEFAKQHFDKKLSYNPSTDHSNVKVLDCEKFTIHSA